MNEFKELYKEFKKVNKLGWIKGRRRGPTNVGYTFEYLINKEEDTFFVPDYGNIEIKTIRNKSGNRIHLFCATPDGDFLFPIQRLLDNLGYPDKDYPDCKVLNTSTNGWNYSWIGYYKKTKLILDNKEKLLRLIAKRKNETEIDVSISWSYELLKERLNLKLKYLAIIETDSKWYNHEEYFYYKKIKFYKLRSFHIFLILLRLGIVNVTFKIGLYKKGNKFKQIHDRGTEFSINRKLIFLLFKRVL